MTNQNLQKWYALLKEPSMEGLSRQLADDVVFYSPVVFAPMTGKEQCMLYLGGAMQVLLNEHFHYLRELVDTDQAVLEFETRLDDIVVNGVDMIRWDESGLIKEFKVMVRPKSGMAALQQRMMAALQAAG